MTKKLFSLAVIGAALGACADSPVSPVDAEPQLARSAAAEAAAAAKPGEYSIVELAGMTPALSTLVFAIETSDAECGTNFAGALSGGGQFTVFAPTNEAFDALIGALGADLVLSCDVLPTVLAYHVTRGRHTSNSVLAVRSFRMLSGERAMIDGTTIAGAPLNLDLIDISASNGIVHVVDAVLLPPSITG
ncbi:MAG: fasciclin domain-containing protein [Longimicrobiales bacterium]|nr:fasciclin domain-containing protein [Longimicrobiales bacterium]